MTLYFRVYVLPHRAACQKFHKFHVIPEKITQKSRYQFMVDEKCSAVIDKGASHKSDPL
jgi:hypothetical protein